MRALYACYLCVACRMLHVVHNACGRSFRVCCSLVRCLLHFATRPVACCALRSVTSASGVSVRDSAGPGARRRTASRSPSPVYCAPSSLPRYRGGLRRNVSCCVATCVAVLQRVVPRCNAASGDCLRSLQRGFALFFTGLSGAGAPFFRPRSVGRATTQRAACNMHAAQPCQRSERRWFKGLCRCNPSSTTQY